MPGKLLAHYEIGVKIGQGGIGEVYRARDRKLGRDVALKILPRSLAENPESIARFQREARALAALNHPNIVTIYSVERDGDTHFLTMELLSGDTLGSAIVPGGVELESFFAIGIPLAEALHAAHAAGVIQRDLKPQNIMLTQSGAPKILDFGLAKQICLDETADTEAQLTSSGQIIGTVDYMSPEHVRGQGLDKRSDLFSLGVILLELLTGQHAFRRSSAPETQSAVLSEPATDAHLSNPKLPPAISRILRRCLEKDPQRRIQSALDLRNELQDLCAELTESRSVRPKSRLLWIAPVLLAAIAIVWALSRNREPALLGDTPAAEPELIRLAILPFVNQGSEDEAFFVEGMREEIASRLGGIAGLGIVSQTTATGLGHTSRRARSRQSPALVGEFWRQPGPWRDLRDSVADCRTRSQLHRRNSGKSGRPTRGADAGCGRLRKLSPGPLLLESPNR